MKKQMLETYLNILGIDFNIKSLEDITHLISGHIKTFPFSSVKVLLNYDISLSLDEIFDSLVINRKGGYCFEHNKLMYEVLKELGFNVSFYLARVVNNSANEVPLTHRFTLLLLDNQRYVIDVGIGFNTPSVPIPFENTIYSHAGFSYKIVKADNNGFFMQKIKDANPYNITQFYLNECVEADFELSHFYSHKHPCAVFVNNLVISLIVDDEIRSLRNNTYIKIFKDKEIKIDLNDFHIFKDVIKNDFNLKFLDDELEFLHKKFVLKQ